MKLNKFKGIALSGLLITGSVLTAARTTDLGFEDVTQWVGPWGQGALGGQGKAAIVSGQGGHPVRTGERSLHLSVEDDGSPNAVAWAGTSHLEPCLGGGKIRAGAWFNYSSQDNFPTEGLAAGQLRLEYFADEIGQELIPDRASLSSGFPAKEDATSSWGLVELYDRVPPEARSVRFSILLLSQKPTGQKKEVWVDDAFLEINNPTRRQRN